MHPILLFAGNIRMTANHNHNHEYDHDHIQAHDDDDHNHHYGKHPLGVPSSIAPRTVADR